mmetsp:Transcript_44459/g.65992  ORF Transcript_44459/g.65992 Transcript_44459/m.65992 type:complete len:260 (-) Transcript_44459:19-798(-)
MRAMPGFADVTHTLGKFVGKFVLGCFPIWVVALFVANLTVVTSTPHDTGLRGPSRLNGRTSCLGDMHKFQAATLKRSRCWGDALFVATLLLSASAQTIRRRLRWLTLLEFGWLLLLLHSLLRACRHLCHAAATKQHLTRLHHVAATHFLRSFLLHSAGERRLFLLLVAHAGILEGRGATTLLLLLVANGRILLLEVTSHLVLLLIARHACALLFDELLLVSVSFKGRRCHHTSGILRLLLHHALLRSWFFYLLHHRLTL